MGDFVSLSAHEDSEYESDESLTDEQIQQLLKEAENRLRKQATDQSSSIQLTEKRSKFPKLDAGEITKPYVQTRDGISHADPANLVADAERKLSNVVRKVQDPVALKKKRLEEKKASAGPDWFNLPKTNLTPELKRDLQLIQMRGVLDPHRHYKKEPGKAKAPEFSQVGTIIEGPTEFFSGRIQNKHRKRTFAEEILAAEAETGRFKKKATEIQMAKSSGKKAHYKALKAKRAGKYQKG